MGGATTSSDRAPNPYACSWSEEGIETTLEGAKQLINAIGKPIYFVISLILHYARIFVHKNKVLLFRLGLTLVFYSVGAAYYHATMGWTPLDSFYFISVSLAMVGYGDLTPNSEGTRLFTTFYMIVGIPLVFAMLSEYFNDIIRRAETKALKQFGKNALHSYTRHVIKFILTVIAMFSSFLIGALFMYYVEDDWTFLQSFYWAVVSSFTIGYGDFHPTKGISKLFSVFYLIVSAIIIALTVSNFTVIRADIRAQRKHIYMLSRRLDMQLLREMCADKGGAGGVTELDFVLFMLVNTKGLDLKRDIEPLRKRFKELDRYNSGILSEKDVVFFEQDETRRKKRALDRLRSLFRAPEYVEVAWEMTHNPLCAMPMPTVDDEEDSNMAWNSTCAGIDPIERIDDVELDPECPEHPRSRTDADLLLEMQELYTTAPGDDDDDNNL